MDVDVTAIPLREAGMEPFEILTSESQERMLAIVEPDDLDEVLAICARWDVRASVIGRVTPGPARADRSSGVDGGGRLRILDGWDGAVLADVPAASLHEDAPLYHREVRAPAGWDPTTRTLAGPAMPDPDADLGSDLTAMLMDTSWVWTQYDHQLFLNTVEGPGGDATVLRLRDPVTGHDTGRGLALTTDGNHAWCAVDPRQGTALTVAESVLNLATVGARPLAVVNCLNFGNPTHPEVMWQLSESIDGMAEACRAFGLPVIGGNVSLYNESRGSDIDPSPVIGMLGLVDRLDRRPPGVGLVDGGRLILVGESQPTLSGSMWARARGHRGGRLPDLNVARHLAVAEVIRALVTAGLLAGVHDVGAGGVGTALAEMAVRSGLGFNAARLHDHVDLFAESPSRLVLCVAPDQLTPVLNVLEGAEVPAQRIGVAGGDRLSVKGLFDLGLSDVTERWRRRLPDALGAGTVAS